VNCRDFFHYFVYLFGTGWTSTTGVWVCGEGGLGLGTVWGFYNGHADGEGID
jgi:hypothetical protein